MRLGISDFFVYEYFFSSSKLPWRRQYGEQHEQWTFLIICVYFCENRKKNKKSRVGCGVWAIIKKLGGWAAHSKTFPARNIRQLVTQPNQSQHSSETFINMYQWVLSSLFRSSIITILDPRLSVLLNMDILKKQMKPRATKAFMRHTQ